MWGSSTMTRMACSAAETVARKCWSRAEQQNRPAPRLDHSGRGAGFYAGGKIGACLRFNFAEALGCWTPLKFSQVDDVC